MRYRDKLNTLFLIATAFVFSVSATPDATDLGGDRQAATSPCSGHAGVVYRYIARTFGAMARIDEYCYDEDYADMFVDQPIDEMLGKCSAEFCAHVTTSRRAPIEHALFQAISSLERRMTLHVKSMDKTYRDASERLNAGISKSVTSFHLDADSKCISELMLYDEDKSLDSGHGGETISSGTIWVEQKRLNSTYRLLIMVEIEYEGYGESEFLRETISCQSASGPIVAKQLSTFGFKVHRENLQEWLISAYRTQ